MKNPLVFTLLIASKNEEKDIHLAIESSIAQTYPHKEILIVDDSTDGTKDIIRSYADQGVTLIDGEGVGCCMARNLGINRATGDVIVFLTADTLLDPNYLELILPHYVQGYDWVAVEAFSYNVGSVYSRFIEMQHRRDMANPHFDPYTSQGYSVQRDAALAVGCISGGVYPVNTCRDWSLGKKLTDAGYKKIFDRSIIVKHKSPDNFSEYWTVRKTRGLFSAYQPYFMFHRTMRYLFLKFTVKSFVQFFRFATILPVALHTFKIVKYSDHPIRDYPLFLYTYTLQQVAFCIGEWQGWWHILRMRQSGLCK